MKIREKPCLDEVLGTGAVEFPAKERVKPDWSAAVDGFRTDFFVVVLEPADVSGFGDVCM